jgi:ABC-type glucose/galactose transport system permease subunit
MYADYVSVFIRPDGLNAVYPLFILISCMIGLVIQTWSGLFISLLSGLFCTLLTTQLFVELNDPMIILYYGAVSPLVAFLISCVGIWALAVLFYLLDGFQYSKRHKME